MCTGVRLIARDGAVVCARTLEFAQNIDSAVIVIPRNYTFAGITTSGAQDGLQWKTRYAVAGTNALGMPIIVDGVNESGLAGGLFYFPGYAQYQEINDNERKQSLAPWQLMTWLLTTCATVKEVQEMLPTIKVCNTLFGPWGFTPPFHAIVHDPTGKSLVIEYVQGILNMYDNPLGVMTNSPTFDWHMTNLNNYSSLSAFSHEKINIGGLTLAPLGQGSGMFGLPGDFTSPSRFVRATALSQTILPAENAQQARDSAFHILNFFNIPLGTIAQKENNKIHYEYTQWTSASDLANKRFYIHTYNNRQIRMVDLCALNLDNKEIVTHILCDQESIATISFTN